MTVTTKYGVANYGDVEDVIPAHDLLHAKALLAPTYGDIVVRFVDGVWKPVEGE